MRITRRQPVGDGWKVCIYRKRADLIDGRNPATTSTMTVRDGDIGLLPRASEFLKGIYDGGVHYDCLWRLVREKERRLSVVSSEGGRRGGRGERMEENGGRSRTESMFVERMIRRPEKSSLENQVLRETTASGKRYT